MPMFLSTPPSRVATHSAGQGHSKLLVSIHATLAGGDAQTAPSLRLTTCFYPRHPRGWRRVHFDPAARRELVSIHATLAGGDTRTIWQRTRPRSFYPRHPRGWRPKIPCMATSGALFLSTPPSRVATRCWSCIWRGEPVSIHATLAGGDPGRSGARPAKPCVSIHATLAGGDILSAWFMLPYRQFLSTPPSRVATTVRYGGAGNIKTFLSTPPSRVATTQTRHCTAHRTVSIHATLAGGDFVTP